MGRWRQLAAFASLAALACGDPTAPQPREPGDDGGSGSSGGGGTVPDEFGPLGDQSQVNAYVNGFQSRPAMAGGNGFVVVWSSRYGFDGLVTTGDEFTIQARRLGGDGAPLSLEFMVNSDGSGASNSPAVAMQPSGDFVVVWWHNQAGVGVPVPGDHSIRARRFLSTGAAVGAEFDINTYTTGIQNEPQIAVDGDGDFAVVWSSDGSDTGSPPDTSSTSIQARLFTSAGTAVGGQFQVNVDTDSSQSAPSVAASPTGDFAVVWESYSDGSGYASVRSRGLSAAGAPLGAEFQVEELTAYRQGTPDISSSGAGFVVAWESYDSIGDTSGYSIQGRALAPDATPTGSEFQVNTYTTSDQRIPVVSTVAGGAFVVAWQSQGSPSDDQTGTVLLGRRFDVNTAPLGEDFQINTYTTGDQENVDVATDANGALGVTWDSPVSPGDDQADDSIQSRLFGR